MKNKKTAYVIGIALLLSTLVLFVPTQPAKAQFVLANWAYPDKYGQGIDFLEIYSNDTGSWVKVGESYDHDETIIYDWNASVAIKIKCWTYFNSTLTGVDSTNEGKLYQQHKVTVQASNKTVIWSQQNITYSNAYPEGDPMYLYVYYVILEFVPLAGEIYTVTILYEIFW